MKKFLQKILSPKSSSKAVPAMLIAVDFDGTCVTENYPKVGQDMPGAVQTLHALVERQHKLILWTCREGEQLKDAVRWFEEREIPLFGINETPSSEEFRRTGGRKVYANLYIDDRSFGGFPGWERIHRELLGKALKPW
ncbi:MAG: hypothetical protein HRT88_06200 [Lentisphaeraceae bacterium]|nr:hypothetical protein [Lentisphaeraceae bacterium]